MSSRSYHRKSKTHHRRSKASARMALASPYLRVLLIMVGLGVFLSASGFSFAASQEAHDSFCASCHTQPESTFYQRSLDAQPVDLATAHKAKEVRCIDCHSGPGVFGRMQAEWLGAHNALAYFTRTAVQPAKQTVPIGDPSCLKCHQQVAVSRDFNNHFHFLLSTWQSQDPANAATCVSCHQGHSTDGDPQIGFLNQATTAAICDACHRVLANE